MTFPDNLLKFCFKKNVAVEHGAFAKLHDQLSDLIIKLPIPGCPFHFQMMVQRLWLDAGWGRRARQQWCMRFLLVLMCLCMINETSSSGAIFNHMGNGQCYFDSITGTDRLAAKFRSLYSMIPDPLEGRYLYTAEAGPNFGRVRKLDLISGIITTVAGSTALTSLYNGDDIPATSANLIMTYSVALDGQGNLYLPEYNRHTIRKVEKSTGFIRHFAGSRVSATSVLSGFSGDNGPATAARLFGPFGVTIDISNNQLYFTDYRNHRIRKIDLSTNIITTVAGTGVTSFNGDGLSALQSNLFYPRLMTRNPLEPDAIYFSEAGGTGGTRIRRFDILNQTIYTIVGNGLTANNFYSVITNSTALDTKICFMAGITVDLDSNIYFTCYYSIFKYNKNNSMIEVFAGNGKYFVEGFTALQRKHFVPYVNPFGNLQAVAFWYNSTNLKSTIGTTIEKMKVNQTLFVGESDVPRVRRIDIEKRMVSVLSPYYDSSTQTSGSMYIQELQEFKFATWYAGTIRKCTTPLLPSTDLKNIPLDITNMWVVPDQSGGSTSFSGAGGGSSSFSLGNVYFVHNSDCIITYYDSSSGTLSHFAGTGFTPYNGDNRLPKETNLNYPWAMTGDEYGYFYITEANGYRIRYFDPFTGNMSVLPGFLKYSTSCNAAVTLCNPREIQYYNHTLYVLESGYNRIRRIYLSYPIASQFNATSSLTGEFSYDFLVGSASYSSYTTNYFPIQRTAYRPNNGMNGMMVTSSSRVDGRTGEMVSDIIVYISEYYRFIKLNVTSDWVTSMIGLGNSNGTAYAKKFFASAASLQPINYAGGMCTDNQGLVYVVDNGFRRIYRVNPSTDSIELVVGDTTSIDRDSVAATSSGFSNAYSCYADPSDGSFYFPNSGAYRTKVVTILAPTSQPTSQPTNPTSQPSSEPSKQPTCQPTGQPTNPTSQPSMQPTAHPTGQPTRQPSIAPSSQPSASPSMPTAQPSRLPTGQPSRQPVGKPTAQPSRQPLSRPTGQPSSQPTKDPTRQPTSQPSKQPMGKPTSQPSTQPSRQPTTTPTAQPSHKPTSQPSRQPSSCPSRHPSSRPTRQPTCQPSGLPISNPTRQPTTQPSQRPSGQPSHQPTCQPSSLPTIQPSTQPSMQPTRHPTQQPSCQPTTYPTRQPTSQPSGQPSSKPTKQPTRQPSSNPSSQPSHHPNANPSTLPSGQPSQSPSRHPSSQPTKQPSRQPSERPTAQPSAKPSHNPTSQPSVQPSSSPTTQPSCQPSRQPTGRPSKQPSSRPSVQPTTQPSAKPSHNPTSQPSVQPSSSPTTQPSCQPSRQPTGRPSKQPSAQPSKQPTAQPSNVPSMQPSTQPTKQPSRKPTVQPTNHPTKQPTEQPSTQPTSQPSSSPSHQSTNRPSVQPTNRPSSQPTRQPSKVPTVQPSAKPTLQPSSVPSVQPTSKPTGQPTEQPSSQPTIQPSVIPTNHPSYQPSTSPTNQPSIQPWSLPTTQPSSRPTVQPTRQPSLQPVSRPTSSPSATPTRLPTSQPTSQPLSTPSSQPSRNPSSPPTVVPSCQPTAFPTAQPSSKPSLIPSPQPSSRPSMQPTSIPSSQPTLPPSTIPSSSPSMQPSASPSTVPTAFPSSHPTLKPTTQPSFHPTTNPSRVPTAQPSGRPSNVPSAFPSAFPTSCPTVLPSNKPTVNPTLKPTSKPAAAPSSDPTTFPSSHPSTIPSSQPSIRPSVSPTTKPSVVPSADPSAPPSNYPSLIPSMQPTVSPSAVPSNFPSSFPTSVPSCRPSAIPSVMPTPSPSVFPTASPSLLPSCVPSSKPSTTPSSTPTVVPLANPTSCPSLKPSCVPSGLPSRLPISNPSSRPSSQPLGHPSDHPSSSPRSQPSDQPTSTPSSSPLPRPSSNPSMRPTQHPLLSPSCSPVSTSPTSQPSCNPTGFPTTVPSARSSSAPTNAKFPTWSPTVWPSEKPTIFPSFEPSTPPTQWPSTDPSISPSNDPTLIPSAIPSKLPSVLPTPLPTKFPSLIPTISPTPIPSRSPSPSPTFSPTTCVPTKVPVIPPSTGPTPVPTFFPIEMPSLYPSSAIPSNYPTAKVVTSNVVSDGFVVAKTSISWNITLLYADGVYAGIYSIGVASLPTSLSSIILQNRYFTCSSEICTVSITLLQPATVYYLYLYPVAQASTSSLNVLTATFDSVNMSRTVVETPCCKEIVVDWTTSIVASTGDGSTTVAQVIPDYLILSSSSFASSSLTLTISLFVIDTKTNVSTAIGKNLAFFYPNTINVVENQAISSSSKLSISGNLPGGLYGFSITCSDSSTYRFVPAQSFMSNGLYSFWLSRPSASEAQTLVLSAPCFKDASFSSDGSKAIISFDKSTDQAGISGTGKFSCSELLVFSCVDRAICSWTSSTQIELFLVNVDDSDCVKPGNIISVIDPSDLRAACPFASCSIHDSWPVTTASDTGGSIIIRSPAEVTVIPTIVMTMPSRSTVCSSIIIDVTSSTGHGGRQWTGYGLSITLAEPDSGSSFNNFNASEFGNSTLAVSILSSFFVAAFSPGKPLVVPAKYLAVNGVYNIVVRLCNFLGKCSVSSKSLELVSTVVPLVTIAGSATRSMKSQDILSISAQGSLPKTQCETDTVVSSSAKLSYNWKVYKDSSAQDGSLIREEVVELVSQSKATNRFLLAAYSLNPNSIYTVVVTATAVFGSGTTATSSSSSTSVQINVISGSLIAVVNQGSAISLRNEEMIVLDGSQSYHEDFPSTSMLVYSWSCVQVSPSLGDSCADILSLSESGEAGKLTVKAIVTDDLLMQTASSGSTIQAEITMSVKEPGYGSSSYATKAIVVTIQPSLSPKVSIVSFSNAAVADYVKINYAESVKLLSTISMPIPSDASALLGYNLSWTIVDSGSDAGIDLGSVALTSTKLSVLDTINGISSSGHDISKNMYLILPNGILVTGMSYVFKMTCSAVYGQRSIISSLLTQYSSSSTFTVEVNEPPRPGKFSVIPSDEGDELSTIFLLSCSQWIDEDLPLTFTFGYTTVTGNQVMTRSRSELAYTETVLPAGSVSDDYYLTVVAVVFDDLLADTTSSFVVKVNEMTTSSVEETKNILSTYLGSPSSSSESTGDLDTLKQSSAIVSYLLNRVNCSLAPINCSSTFHRSPCSNTAHTCGSCLSDYPIGEQGDSNSICYRSVESMFPTVLDSQRLLDEVDSIVANKSCLFDCSGHGVCQFKTVQSPSIIVTECKTTDMTCRAECLCVEEFSGDAICSTTREDLLWKHEARSQLVTNLQALHSTEDSTIESIASLQNMLIEASKITREIATTSIINQLLNITSTCIADGQQLGLEFDRFVASYSVLDSIATAISVANELTSVEDPNESAGLVNSFIYSLSSMSSLVGGNIVANQDPVSHIEDNFKLFNSKMSFTGNSVELSLPLSPLEQAVEAISPSLKIEIGESESSLEISFSTISSNLLPSQGLLSLLASNEVTNVSEDNMILSDIVKLDISSKSLSTDSAITFTLPVVSSDITSDSVVESYSYTCEKRDTPISKSFVCSSTGDVLKFDCDGINAGTYTQRCPIIQKLPSCSLMEPIPNFGLTSNCSRVSFDASSQVVHCRCTLIPSMGSYDRRYLTNITDDTISVSIISLLEATKTQFVSTWVSAGDLNAQVLGSRDSRPALLTMSLFIGCAILFVFIASVVDEFQEEDEQELAQQYKDQNKKSILVSLGQSQKKLATNSSNWTSPTKFTVKLLKLSGSYIAKKTEFLFGESKFKKMDPKLKSRTGEVIPTLVNRQRLPGAEGSMIARGSVKKNDMLSLAEEALPKILSTKSSFRAKCVDELKRHHRWLAIFYFYSKKFPRVLRVVALVTNIVIILFIQSVTYNLTRGSDTNCSPYSYTSELDCLTSQSSAYDSSESMCYWDASTQECKYREPANNEIVIFYVAIFSALITTPLTLVVDWIIQHILAAPTKFERPQANMPGNGLWSNATGAFTNLIAKVAPQPSHDSFIASDAEPVSPTITDENNDSPQLRSSSMGLVLNAFSNRENSIEDGTKPNREGRQSMVQFLRTRRSTNILLALSQRSKKNKEGESKDKKNFILQAQSEYRLLSQELVRYRSFLSENDRIEFDRKWSIVVYFLQILIEFTWVVLGIWGLTISGLFITKGASVGESSLQRFLPSSWIGARHDVAKTVLNDLEQVGREQHLELNYLTNECQNGGDRERNKRILFLFQRDLLSGISGKILESKDRRDYVVLSPVSALQKQIGWGFLFVFNLALLIYIFLFAIGQDEGRQQAWSKSFGMWLLMEIVVISSLMTILTHVVVPSLIMKDVQEIKRKLALSVSTYYQDLTDTNTSPENNGTLDIHDQETAKAFNAASYLFVSYRVAKSFTELKSSKIILRFKTVWPRQSYQHVTDLTKSYSKKFSALTRSAALVILFFLTSVVNLPAIIHDLLFQTASILLAGSIIFLHIKLYRVSPALIIVPSLAVFAIAYVVMLQRTNVPLISAIKSVVPAPINEAAMECDAVKTVDNNKQINRISEENDEDQENDDHECVNSENVEKDPSSSQKGKDKLLSTAMSGAGQRLRKTHELRKRQQASALSKSTADDGKENSEDCDNSNRSSGTYSHHSGDEDDSYDGSDRVSNEGSRSGSGTCSRSGSGYGSGSRSGSGRSDDSQDKSGADTASGCDTVSHHSFESFRSINSFDIANIESLIDGSLDDSFVTAGSAIGLEKTAPINNKESKCDDVDSSIDHLIVVRQDMKDLDIQDEAMITKTNAEDDEWVLDLLDDQLDFKQHEVDEVSRAKVDHRSRRHSTVAGLDLLKKARQSILK